MGTVLKLVDRYRKLESDKSQHKPQLQEIAEFFQPEKAGFFGVISGSNDKRKKIFDSTPEEALEILAAALQTLLTNPMGFWFSINLILNSDDVSAEIKEWMSNVEKLMMAKFNSEEAGFHSAVHELYMDLPSFGTAVFYVDEFEGIRFTCIPLSEVAVAENAKGLIDTVFREFEMTARQMVEKWPKGVSVDVRKVADEDPERKYKIIHAVQPRVNYIKDSKRSKDLPIESIYFEYATNKILSESGYSEMPYMVPRWSKTSGQVYGRGGGHKSLPDARVLNEMSRSEMIAVDKAADPATILPHDGFLTDFESDGGAINYHRSTGDIREKIMTLGSDADLNAIRTAIIQKQDSIRRKFLNDKLQMVGGPQMTATEVIAVQNEKMRILGPVLGRLQGEFLAPLINRVFNIMLRNGELPQPPEELQNQVVKIQYVSPISRAQKQTDAEAVKAAFDYLMPFLQFNPGILKHFDFDQMARDTQELFGYSAKYLKSLEQVQKEAEAQQAAQEKQAAMVEASQGMELEQQAKDLRAPNE